MVLLILNAFTCSIYFNIFIDAEFIYECLVIIDDDKKDKELFALFKNASQRVKAGL